MIFKHNCLSRQNYYKVAASYDNNFRKIFTWLYGWYKDNKFWKIIKVLNLINDKKDLPVSS